jgi:hypothetical protein
MGVERSVEDVVGATWERPPIPIARNSYYGGWWLIARKSDHTREIEMRGRRGREGGREKGKAKRGETSPRVPHRSFDSANFDKNSHLSDGIDERSNTASLGSI